MESIRKGKDIYSSWAVMTPQGAVLVPYDLEGKDLALYLECSCGKIKVEDFKTEGNVIRWTFYGKDQKHLGVYSLELVVNEGREGMATVDKHNAFCLVGCTCEEGGEPEDGMECVYVRFESYLRTTGEAVPVNVDLEGYMPMMREFSDDFNNDFTR